MSDKVIIIDEESESDNIVLSQEEIEEIERSQRLNKLFRKRKKRDNTLLSNLSKIINVVALFGIAIGMLLESGMIAAICLGIIFISCIVNYIFLK